MRYPENSRHIYMSNVCYTSIDYGLSNETRERLASCWRHCNICRCWGPPGSTSQRQPKEHIPLNHQLQDQCENMKPTTSELQIERMLNNAKLVEKRLGSRLPTINPCCINSSHIYNCLKTLKKHHTVLRLAASFPQWKTVDLSASLCSSKSAKHFEGAQLAWNFSGVIHDQQLHLFPKPMHNNVSPLTWAKTLS